MQWFDWVRRASTVPFHICPPLLLPSHLHIAATGVLVCSNLNERAARLTESTDNMRVRSVCSFLLRRSLGCQPVGYIFRSAKGWKGLYMWTKVAEIADSMITQDLTNNGSCWSQVLVLKIGLNLPEFYFSWCLLDGYIFFAGTFSCFY